MKLVINILFFLVISLSSYAQIDIVPDAVLAEESAFIEAKKYALIGRYDKAEEGFLKLYEKDKNNAVIAYELAKIYEGQENVSDAMKFAELAMQKSSEPIYLDYLGVLATENERFDRAIGTFKQLYDGNKGHEEYADKLATAYFLNGDYKQSLEVYESLETAVGVKKEISKHKIDLYQKLNDEKGIERELIKLIEYYPDAMAYKERLAAFYMSSGQKTEAQDLYNEILRIDPDNTAANLALIGDPDEPIDDNKYLRGLLPIIKDNKIPIDRKVLELIPYVNQLSEKHDEELAASLESVTEKLKNTHPDEAKAYAIYGDVLMLNSKIDEAIPVYKKTIDLNDNIFAVWDQLMTAYYIEKDYNELASLSEKAIDYYPNEPSSYRMNAHALSHIGQEKQAISILEEAVLIASGDEDLQSKIYTDMAATYIKIKDFGAAKTNIDKALEISDGSNKVASDLLEKYKQEFFMRGIK